MILSFDEFRRSEPEFRQAYKKNKYQPYTAEDIVLGVSEGKLQIWNDAGLWAITEVVESKGENHLYITSVTGMQQKSWAWYIMVMEAFAKDNHCQYMHVIGREGWKKALPEFEFISTHIRKKVDYGTTH